MDHVILTVVCLLTTGFAWRRIFAARYAWHVTAIALMFTLVPILGPLFYLMIDPPDSTPPGVKPKDFWYSSKGGLPPGHSFDPLIKSLGAILKKPQKKRR